MPLSRPAVVLAVLFAVQLPATPARAHNELRGSDPPDGAALAAAPAAVTLTFAESLDARYTQIVVTDAERATIPTGAPSVAGATGAVTLPPDLADGRYTVAYRVVSLDGHPVRGAIRFTVGTAAPARAAPPTEPEPADRRPLWWVVAGAVLLGAGALVVARRTARR